MELLLKKQVYLELYVKTLKKWRDKEKYLNELGFNEFWDLIFKRYSSPFSLLDSLIENNMFSKFIENMINKYNDELLWDIYINNIEYIGTSFNEFKRKLNTDITQVEYLSDEDLKTTVNKSKDILSNFKPQ